MAILKLSAFGTVATFSILLLSITASSVHADAYTRAAVVDNSYVKESREIEVMFSQPLSLTDAIELTRDATPRPIAYRFDNGQVVGEYSSGGGYNVDEFLNFFLNDYGTEPRVVSYKAVETVNEAWNEAREGGLLEASAMKTFAPPPVKFGGSIVERNAMISAHAPESPLEASMSLQSSVPSDWRPDSTNHGIFQVSGFAFFGQQFTWQGNGLYTLPNQIGLEFEINQDRADLAAPNNLRPFCLDTNYKTRHWAQNQNYSWVATDWFGSSPSTDTWIGAYADYNDLTDLCRTSSIAIGLRYPKDLTPAGGQVNQTTLDLVVSAPRGAANSNQFSGNVQAVSSLHCIETGNWMAYTDCMGVTPIQSVWGGSPSGVYNRSTLNASRQWTIPARCWSTYSINAKADTVVESSCSL